MRVLLRALILLFAAVNVGTRSFADLGWFWQNPLPQGNSLRSVATPDASTVIAVGDSGTILRSIAGGASWALQGSVTNNSLLALCFVDADTGWTVGQRETILHTTDRGATWARQSSGTNNPLSGISCTDASTCWAVGGGGTILHTTTGGE